MTQVVIPQRVPNGQHANWFASSFRCRPRSDPSGTDHDQPTVGEVQRTLGGCGGRPLYDMGEFNGQTGRNCLR